MTEPRRRHDEHDSDKRGDDCLLKCRDHAVWEQRMKVMDTVPELLTWMNKEKGSRGTSKWLVTIFLGVIIASIFTVIANVKSDMTEKQVDQDAQVKAIAASVAEIKTQVAVLVKIYELVREQDAKEAEENKRAIKELRIEMNNHRATEKR